MWFLWLQVNWLKAEHDVVFLTYQNSFRLQLEENALTSFKKIRCDQSMLTPQKFSNSCGKSICFMLCTVCWGEPENLLHNFTGQMWEIYHLENNKRNKSGWGGVGPEMILLTLVERVLPSSISHNWGLNKKCTKIVNCFNCIVWQLKVPLT